jgi:hypothetical protein
MVHYQKCNVVPIQSKIIFFIGVFYGWLVTSPLIYLLVNNSYYTIYDTLFCPQSCFYFAHFGSEYHSDIFPFCPLTIEFLVQFCFAPPGCIVRSTAFFYFAQMSFSTE